MLTSEIEGFLLALRLEDGLSANTVAAYQSDLTFFVEYLKGRGIDEAKSIQLEDIVSFLSVERVQGRKSSTRARRTAAIRTFFRYLKTRHLIAHNPTELMDSTKKELALPRILSEVEVASIIDAVDGADARSLRDRAILEVLYGCGLRVSELCDLKRDAIVADGELIRILGKGTKERLVPIGGAAGRTLSVYLEGARGSFAHGNLAEDHIFLTRRGGKFTRQGIFKIIKERAANVGILPNRVSPHVFRHSYASHMLSHGADIRAIQEMLGHADIGTTQIYTHVDVARFGEIHRKFHPRAKEVI